MKPTLRIAFATFVTFVLLLWPLSPVVSASGGQFISSYWLVSWRPVAPNVVEFTLRATLTNLGAPIPGATAVATSASPALTVVDGTLTFGPVGRYRTAPSSDTFTVRFDCRERLYWPVLRWSIAPTTSNLPPVADAGPDQVRRVTEVAQLDGRGSRDPEGRTLTYRWTLLEVPSGSAATLSSAGAAQPTFLVDRPGRYVARLVVNDGATDSTPDTVTITTENTAPVANAGPDQTLPVTRTVTLDGSRSSDIDGEALAFRWRAAATPAGSNAQLSDPTIVNPTFVIDRPGSYTFELVVSDGRAASPPDSVTISTVNSGPVANAGPDQATVLDATVALNGSGSHDVDGDALRFAWSFISKPAGSAATLSDPAAVAPTFVVDVRGNYWLRLSVNDGQLTSEPDVVVVSTGNTAPVAHAGYDQRVEVGGTAALNGSASTDVDGDILSYSWSFTSVPAGSAATLINPSAVAPTFVPDVTGRYVLQLVVHDGRTLSQPDTVAVSTENTPPVADAGPDQAVVAGQAVLLEGTASFDADGDAISYRWAITSQPAGSTATLLGETTDLPTLIVDRAGTYVVQLIVADDSLESVPDTVTISTTNTPPVANAGTDQLAVEVGSYAFLDGTGSADADGHALSFRWVLLSAPVGTSAVLANANTPQPSFNADVVGDYIAQLIVNDGFADSAPDTVTVRVTGRPLPTVTIESADPTASEDLDVASFRLIRTGDSSEPLTVNILAEGSATSGDDYSAVPLSVTIPAGVESIVFDILPVDDELVEQTERVEVRVAAGDGYIVGDPDVVVITIDDNDLPVVTVTASDADASEAGSAPGAFTFFRTGDTSMPLVVSFTRSGSTGAQDYADFGQSVTFVAGAASATLTIVPLADTQAEGAETLVLTIEPADSYVVGLSNAATVTIADLAV